MDPRNSAQDIIRCDICKDNIVQNYCDFCHVNLCMLCVGEHISDGYHKHTIVPFEDRKSTLKFPACNKHSKEICKLQCKSCNGFICALCSASDEHKGHNFFVLEDIYKTKKKGIENDAEEIEKVIVHTYEDIRNELINQIATLDEDYEKITTVVSEQGDEWHTEVDTVINKIKNEITEIKEKHRSLLEKHLSEIKQIESLIEGNLYALKELEESNDVSVIVEHRPRIQEFRKLPPKVLVTLPTFCPKPINRELFNEMFGSLKPFMSTSDENGYKMKLPAGSPRELVDIPEVINTFNTGCSNLRSISVYTGKEIWTSAEIPVGGLKCFSTDGKSMRTITTKSGEWPNDIAVTSGGELVYCDWKLKTLNKMKDGEMEEITRLQGWIPVCLCVTSTGDFLVSICNDDKTQSKVVRYLGSAEKQTIQFDDEGKPLYSGNYKIKYITENRNHDICVADCKAGAVVVVNQDGKLRWRYTCHPSVTKNRPFKPRGITSDSQSRILTADYNNHCIHILDQDGHFLCYITDLKYPFGLCVDELDNLFVTEFYTGDVKLIQYLK